jgi:pantoate--beta-alanine ligase
MLVKNMANAFFLETEIIGCSTIRNHNNLPLSSRNNRFTPEQFENVQNFSKIFHADLNPEEIKKQLISAGFEVEYVEDFNSRRFAAVKFEGIRLIDNRELIS